MATTHEKLAASLKELRKLQKSGKRVIRSNELTRVHRERLEQAGYLEKIIQGWLMSTTPDALPGDTTPWFSCFWEFCRRYCESRFAKSWHLSTDQSLLIHSGDMSIPYQVVVHARKGQSNLLELPSDVKLIDLPYPKKRKITQKDIDVISGLNVLKLPLALAIAPASFFKMYSTAAEVILGSIENASVVLPPLLEEGRTIVAGRLAGAFRHMGRKEIAYEICEAMKDAGHSVHEDNPFEDKALARTWTKPESPVIGRMNTLWDKARTVVLEECPDAPPGVQNIDEYLASVEEAYTHDAYHSLSIEGYMVSEELIERVASGNWNPEENTADANDKNALACRGYLDCFGKVKRNVKEVLEGGEAGAVARRDHGGWYRALFGPHVRSGLLNAVALAGYRNHPVFIKGSRHAPVNEASVPDAMNTLFDRLEGEESPMLAAVLGHWMLGYIHPYSAGNGRMARFLMNLMLASGGYPWTTIKVDDRDTYMAALESASVDNDIRPFAKFIVGAVLGNIQTDKK
ncbi:MAG: Fic family protein [Pseudodesulfovibrio sp.]